MGEVVEPGQPHESSEHERCPGQSRQHRAHHTDEEDDDGDDSPCDRHDSEKRP